MSNKVKEFYNQNYKRFDTSRYSVWSEVQNFIDKIPPGSNVLDSGCGNGKNMIYLKNRGVLTKGIDFSEKLLDVCMKKNFL